MAATSIALALLGAACGDGDDAEEGTGDDAPLEVGSSEEAKQDIAPEYGGTITVGILSETNTWSTTDGNFDAPGVTVAMSFYDPLVGITDDGEFAPFLAESLEPNEDLTEWTLQLREGVTFHDGSPFDGEALKWNFDNLHSPEESRTRSTLDQFGVTSMQLVDDLTVTYILSEPSAAFPDLLTGPVGWPVSPTAVQSDPEGWGNNDPSGTGPFVFESWTRDGELRVSRNENYWMSDEDGNQLPYLDGIEFRPVPDEGARVASLQSDSIGVLQTFRGPTVKALQSMVDEGGYEMSTYVGNTSSASLLNVLEPPLDDVRIRTAMAMANDQEALAAIRDDNGLVPPTTGFFSTDSPWYSADADSAYPGGGDPDPEGATAGRPQANPSPSATSASQTPGSCRWLSSWTRSGATSGSTSTSTRPRSRR